MERKSQDTICQIYKRHDVFQRRLVYQVSPYNIFIALCKRDKNKILITSNIFYSKKDSESKQLLMALLIYISGRGTLSNYRKNKEFGQEKTMISSSLKRIKQR